MAATDLLTVGKIAAQLKVSDGKVKKALAELKVAPTAKKGPCNYYSPDVVNKIKKALA